MSQRRYPIIKLADDVYIEWVGACDAPGSAYTRAQIVEMFEADIREAEETLELQRGRLARLDANNHTYLDRGPSTPQELVAFNRAGPKEGSIKFETMLRKARAELEAEARR
jgi:hypothetical protein